MDSYEKVALKAACIQAAAILVAPLSQSQSTGATPAQPPASAPPFAGRARNEATPPRSQGPDTAACAAFARDLFGKLTGEAWD